MKEKISVIIPMYNVEEYIEECLMSVVNQDYGLDNIEVLMIDDCSTDKTSVIAEKFKNKYNFILIKNKKNSGLAITRNKGVKEASGEYITFLDSDDLLCKNSLSAMYENIKKSEADMVIGRLNAFDSKGNYGYYSDKFIDKNEVTNIYRKKDLINCTSVCSKLYKADFIKNVEFIPNTYHEDNYYTLTLLFKANKIVILPEYLYLRRFREGDNQSIMQKLDYKKFKDLLFNYREALKNINTNKNIKFLYKYMIRKLNNYLIKNVKKEDYKKAKADIKEFINSINKSWLFIYSAFYYNIAKIYVVLKK